MNYKKCIATTLAVTVLATVPFVASAKVPVQKTSEQSVIAIAENQAYNLPLCEFMIAVVKHIDGEQPPLMDTHYAYSYMLRAEQMGFINLADYPESKWNMSVDTATAEKVLSAVEKQNKDVSMEQLQLELAELSTKGISIHGQNLNLASTSVFPRNNLLMVPLRLVAESLGFEVTWKAENRCVEIINGVFRTTIEIGYDCYYESVSTDREPDSVSLGTAPLLIDGTTYVPVQMFNVLFGQGAVSFANNVVDIQLPQF